MQKTMLVLLILLIITGFTYAEETIVFTGIPKIKISENGVSRIPETLSKDMAIQFKCIIRKSDDKYYWTSRENVELLPITSGAFITYMAINGSGYIRLTKPKMREVVRKMGTTVDVPEENFDYVEHLLLGLKSITYYGMAK
ncbi:MAG: hypothetical protein GY799_11330 [Desulfobulbaceae bacterium]|nr:hypothetical protein [Desulfobulbaceae bacterium]